MVLVDTPVWVEHLRNSSPALRMTAFRTCRVHADGKSGAGRMDTMTRAGLDEGNVVIRIACACACANDKDALTARGDLAGSRSRRLLCVSAMPHERTFPFFIAYASGPR